MNKIMGVVLGIIGIAVVMLVFPIITDTTDTVQTERTTQVEAAVATGVGEVAADVVLTEELFNNSTVHVISIVSDNVADTPVAGTYTSATQTLNVTGLAADDTRELTIIHNIDALSDYTGMGTMVSITPLLVWITIIAILIAGIGAVFRGQGT